MCVDRDTRLASRDRSAAGRQSPSVAVTARHRRPRTPHAHTHTRTRHAAVHDMATRQFTRKEVEAHNRRDDALIIIDNVVYDMTHFFEDHPGGVEVLLDNAGKDASKCFLDVGHSDDAYEWRRQYVAGEVVEAERREVLQRPAALSAEREPLSPAALLRVAVPPIAMAVVSVFLYVYLFG